MYDVDIISGGFYKEVFTLCFHKLILQGYFMFFYKEVKFFCSMPIDALI